MNFVKYLTIFAVFLPLVYGKRLGYRITKYETKVENINKKTGNFLNINKK